MKHNGRHARTLLCQLCFQPFDGIGAVHDKLVFLTRDLQRPLEPCAESDRADPATETTAVLTILPGGKWVDGVQIAPARRFRHFDLGFQREAYGR